MAIYLIDYENVYIEGLTGLESLTKEDEVIIFYTQNRCGLTFELHRRLISCQASLQLMEVSSLSNRKNTVKNALDLQLSMYIGYLIGSRPSVPLYIISKDTDFDLNLSFYTQYLQQGEENLSIHTTIAQTFAASDSDTEEQNDFAKPEKSEAEVAVEESKKQKPTVQFVFPEELQSHVVQLLDTNDKAMVRRVCASLTAAEDLLALNNLLSRYYRDGKQVKEIYHKLKPSFAQLRKEATQK